MVAGFVARSLTMYIHLLSLGRVPYTEALEIQARVVAARKQGRIGDTLLLLEHPPVLTLGRNASRANILVGNEWLASHGVELHEVNRGGDVTYHGPGQLVGYPIVDLRGEWPNKRGPHLGPVDFVRLLEEALIRACADFGVLAKRIPKCTGVWTLGDEDALCTEDSLHGAEGPRGNDPLHGGNASNSNGATSHAANQPAASLERKLAAIGVHVSQGITSHGFALNVTTDLRDFQWIVPCGIRDRGVTSLLHETGPAGLPHFEAPTMANAIHAVARNFGRVFQRQMLCCDSLEQLLAQDESPRLL